MRGVRNLYGYMTASDEDRTAEADLVTITSACMIHTTANGFINFYSARGTESSITQK